MSIYTETDCIPYPSIVITLQEIGVEASERETLVERIKREADKAWRTSEFFRSEMKSEGWRDFFAGYVKAVYRRLS